MDQHHTSLTAGTETVGASARQLLQDPRLEQPQMKCPLCETLVDIPATLKQDIKNLAQELGGEDAHLLFTIHHPPSIPQSPTASRVRVTDPERLAQLKDAWKKSKGL